MGFFKKDIFEYKILERYKIDIAKTNRNFRDTPQSKGLPQKREYCEKIGESEKYIFYSYLSYNDGSGGYVLRASKEDPRNIVYFGENKKFSCIYKNHLFLVDTIGFTRKLLAISRDIDTGVQFEYDWFGKRSYFKGHGNLHRISQDSVNGLSVINDQLVFDVTRTRVKPYDENDDDEYNIDSDYKLIVNFKNGSFYATAVFPSKETSAGQSSSGSATDNFLPKQLPKTLGRDETKHISCKYPNRPHLCEKDCDSCAIALKTDGDYFFAHQKYNDAIKMYLQAVVKEPDFAEAWLNLGNAYGSTNQYEKALSAFNIAIRIDPVYGKAMFGKAITLRNMGNLQEALNIVNEILKLYDNSDVLDFKKKLLHTISSNSIKGHNLSEAKSNTPHFCHKCGNKLIEGSIFCNMCGTKIPLS